MIYNFSKNSLMKFYRYPFKRALAAQLLTDEDYKLKCSDYFTDINDDGTRVFLKFPYFNLLFLVLYLVILSIQVICMLKHRYSTLCHYLSNISFQQTVNSIESIKEHNEGSSYKGQFELEDFYFNFLIVKVGNVKEAIAGLGDMFRIIGISSRARQGRSMTVCLSC